MILPAVLYVVVLAFYPAINAVYGSFFTRLGKFGLYNYTFVLDQYGTAPIYNTFIVTASALLLQFTAGFVIAGLLSKPFRGKSIFSAIFLIPFGVATIVTAVIFYHMFGVEGGYVNSFLRMIGVGPINWTGSFSSSLFVIVLADSWKNTPIVTLILLAGMTTISPDLYSQAMVDGAGLFQRFFRITLPNMAGFIAIALMIRGISEFNIFAMALLIFPYQLLTTMTFSLYDIINARPSEAAATILLGFVLIFATFVMIYRTKYGKVS
ncbi:MAG: hypothetical protein B2I17_09440 [Thermoplasmatales archaeon B_DKE]|nr:MAG: hypothetical protein B2I17_09440 [Thermoplasmatales archaeon B_DKE]